MDPIEKLTIRRSVMLGPPLPGLFRRRSMSSQSDEARMLTKSLRGALGMALAVVMTVSALAEWASAQQMGMFPLAPIRRQRVPCDQEDPVYQLYKEQYFGYHPTMWRKFPDGWGAPSPEAPNAAASYAEIPLQPPEDLDWGYEPNDEFGEEPGMGAPPQGPQGMRPALPTPPEEGDRSPFELEGPNGAGGALPGRDEPPIPPRPAAPDEEEPSPFEQFNPRANAPGDDKLELAPPTAARSARSNRWFDRNVAEAGRPILSTDGPAIRVDGRGSGLEDMSDALEAQPVNPRPVSARAEASRQEPPRRSRVATLIDAPRWSPVRR